MKNNNGIQLTVKFPGNKRAEEWFEEERWGKTVNGLPESICCPHCGCRGRITPCPDSGNRPYWCGDCRSHFSVRTGTVMSHSKISLVKWATALYLHVSNPKGISALQLSRILDLNYRSAWFLLHRIREGWPDPEPLRSRIAEIDQAWVGGDDKKRHGNKKFGNHWRKGRVLVSGLYDRDTGRAATEVILNEDRGTLFSIAEEHLEKTETLFSDDAAVFSDFGWEGRHETVTHKGEYVRADVHTNSMESFWALLKRIYRGIYHHISPKYFPRYLNEITERFNVRGMEIPDRMKLLVSGMLGKRLTLRNLLATEVPPTPYTHHRSGERAKLFE